MGALYTAEATRERRLKYLELFRSARKETS